MEVNALKEQNSALEKKIVEDTRKARKDERDRIIKAETEKRTKKRRRIYFIFTGLFIIGFIAVLYATGRWLWSVDEMTEKAQAQNDFVKYVIDAAYIIVTGGIIVFGFKGLDKEKIAANILKSVEKEYASTDDA